ncbi:glyoxalase [Pseudoxanthomonas dokdonensis]|uniref:Glyoxalase n=1 Tax=Pseudoxanthomonas dokdonensis TaxID=344882 RepID=A0A0R0CC37_9GAMM|nr:glyoxalase [Pseudoxanthomonas dokdonensis]
MQELSVNNASGSSIIPCLRYRDAPAAIDWLCRAFGFSRHAVYQDGDIVHHAQLVHGNGMIMLGSVANQGPWGKLITQPDQLQQNETQSPCVLVEDVDAHYAQAVACGATIVIDIADQGYGGRGYGCRDPEGHLWWFGSYNPWTARQDDNGNG